MAIGQRKYLMVAINYFTKLVEAKVVAYITTNEVKKCIWENIIKYGVPRAMIFDNGWQFYTDGITDCL